MISIELPSMSGAFTQKEFHELLELIVVVYILLVISIAF